MAVKIPDDCERIRAKERGEFTLDPKGYFLIRVLPEEESIEVGHCKRDNVIERIIVGKKPKEIFETIVGKGLVSRLEHAAYLGRELQKAYVALRLGIEYVQDDELNLP